MTTRRQAIKTALGGALGAAFPLAACGPGAGPSRLTVAPLAEGVVMISGGGGNVIAAADADGVVIVDAGSAEFADDLVSSVSQTFRSRSVHTLFNTHWHPEQTGANERFARTGAEIIAHENTRLWLGSDVEQPWSGDVIARLPSQARPTNTFRYDAQVRGSGPSRIEYGYLHQAHTDGDVYVFFPAANVLAIGGVVAGDRWALVDWWTGGWIGGLVEGVETLLQIANDDTLIVPSDGPVITRAELAAQFDMYAQLFVRLRDDLLFASMSPEEAVAAAPTRGLKPEWSDHDAFVTRSFESMWGYFAPDA